jgi:MFS family permease
MLLTVKLGYNERVSGILLTIIIASGGLGLLLGGKLSDKFGRKKIIILFNLLSAFAFIICAFTSTSPLVPYIILIANFFSMGQLPAINAMITDITDKETRKNAFSSPIIAGFLFNNYFTLIFLLDAITTILALIPIILFVKETLPSKDEMIKPDIEDLEKAEKRNVFVILFKKPVLVIFAFVSIIYSMVYAQYSFGLPIYVNDIFSTKGPVVYGTIMSVNAIVVVTTTLFLIASMKKIKPIINIGISGLLYAIGFGVIFFSKLYYLLIISTIIWTLGEIINTVNTSVFIANHSPMSHRGRFNAIITFITQSGFAISPLLFGIFIKHYGARSIWPLIFLLAIFASLIMFGLGLFEKARKRKLCNNSLEK